MITKKDILTINGKDEKSFLKHYNHDIPSVSEFGLKWDELVGIHDYYQGIVKNKLEIAAQTVFLDLKTIDGAHTVKYRIKDPEHLIDKIIRKKQLDVNRQITIDNFMDEFDDLIGFRILHLFKNDWEPIFNSIKRYECVETPVAYCRDGDDSSFINRCKELGLDVQNKGAGYRSIHYIAAFPFFKSKYKCEIQIRTIFEEAWSEIDHLVRYPNNTSNELLNSYLLLFNRLAGCADDMGVFLMTMKSSLAQYQSERAMQEDVIVQLQKEVSKLKGKSVAQRKKIDDLLDQLNKSVGTGWYDSLTNNLPLSYTNYISSIQNPSGVSMYSPVTGLPVSTAAQMTNIIGGNGLYSPLNDYGINNVGIAIGGVRSPVTSINDEISPLTLARTIATDSVYADPNLARILNDVRAESARTDRATDLKAGTNETSTAKKKTSKKSSKKTSKEKD